jgi:cytosine/adenosine deaminase-related metal-dependent hydrolase
MIKYISADWLFPISAPAIANGIVAFDTDNQQIVAVNPPNVTFGRGDVQHYQGIVCPAFINTHCHLELSHMLGKAPTGTGLLDFIGNVVANRAADEATIQEAIQQADATMYANGINAVGDICNQTDTFAVKNNSLIRYYSFVECFDFWQKKLTQPEFDKYQNVFNQLQPKRGDFKTLVPHAPYSVSPAMFELIHQHQSTQNVTVSIHNQETVAENQLFVDKNSPFVDMWAKFGFDYNDLTQLGNTAIFYLLAQLNPQNRNLLVHNTLTTAAEITAAQQILPNLYFATCPNANLYIENRLPNYQNFIHTNARLTIGTDSLTSNWTLSVLDELKTIAKYNSYIPTQTLLEWATLNGAEALGMQANLGSIETGKRCGLININSSPEASIVQNSSVQRII